MEPLEYRSIVPLEVLAASLAMRLSIEEREWLWRGLSKRTEAERREEVQRARGASRTCYTHRLHKGRLGNL
jgi:hypothetical protein